MVIGVMTNLSQRTITPVFVKYPADSEELVFDPDMGVFEFHNEIGRFHTSIIGHAVPHDAFNTAVRIVVTSRYGTKYDARGPFNPENPYVVVRKLEF